MILKKLSTVVLTVLMLCVMSISSFANETIPLRKPACNICESGGLDYNTTKKIGYNYDCPLSHDPKYMDTVYQIITINTEYCDSCSYSYYENKTIYESYYSHIW